MMNHRRRLLAAPILGERGGGVGQVSDLLWRTMREEWGAQAEVVTLLDNGHDKPAAPDKLRFGLALASRQIFERPAWILFSHLGLARVERFLPRTNGTPYAVFLHGIECWSPLPPGDVEILKRAALRVANSAYTARQALAANPGIGEIVVCPLALNEMPVQSSMPRAANATPIVLVVGRLSATERYKGHEQLIETWPRVLADVPTARLVIVGEGDDRTRLEALAGARVPAGSVEFRGFVSRAELNRCYQEASLFVLPSRGEGFGLVYLEAMAHGLACVGSTRDAASEVIVHGETGVLVDPDEPDAIATAIAGLLSSPGRMAAFGQAGRLRVASEFTYEHFRTRMIALLREHLVPQQEASY